MDEVLESFPAVHVDELNTYSAAVSQYYHVGEVHTLVIIISTKTHAHTKVSRLGR
jgi:hypothetical protein